MKMRPRRPYVDSSADLSAAPVSRGSDPPEPASLASDPRLREQQQPLTGSCGDLLRTLAAGLRDALSVHLSLLFVFTSATVRRRTLQCTVLNGLLFLGSIAIWNWGVAPIVETLLVVEDNEKLAGVGHTLTTMTHWLFQMCWLWPIYGISFILNTIWYQDIADASFAIKGHTPKAVPLSLPMWVDSIAQELYRLLLVGVYLLQIFVVSFLPFGLGEAACCLLMAWLYSFYSFEYAWGLQRMPLQQRLKLIETRWTYFAGFGLPAALLTYYSPRFIDLGVFALTFPLFIILGINSTPRPHVSPQHPAPWWIRRLPIFLLVNWVNGQVLRLLHWAGARHRSRNAAR